MKTAIHASLAGLFLATTLVSAPARAANEASFCSFQSSASLLQLNGDAAIVGSVLRVVPNVNGKRGTAYLATPIAIAADTSFRTHFRFRFTPNTSATGGEGIMFVIQNASPFELGSSGPGLGYGAVTPSVAVEFDTNSNAGTGDPDANHIGVHANGVITSHLATATLAQGVPTMDGATVDAWIDYDGVANEIKVFMSTTTVKPASPLLDYTGLDLGAVGTQGYVGFSGSTASAASVPPVMNDEDILYWAFTTGTTLTDCTVCTTSASCTSPAFPTCDMARGQCVQCASDSGGASFACPSTSFPACQSSGSISGQCTQCSATRTDQCGVASGTPICDTSVGTCAACTGDNGVATALPCPSSSARACQASGACTACSSTNTSACTATTPTCTAAGACAGCAANQGSGLPQACPSAALPACQANGSCAACSASRTNLCSGVTPTCNLTSGSCAPCNGDRGSAASQACTSAVAPACLPSGACGACSATNLSLCYGALPTCDTTTFTCAGCNGDNGTSTSRTCPSASAPACRASGECTACSATNVSLCTGLSPTCNTATGTCAPCDGDNGSGSTKACTTSANPYCVATGGLAGSCSKCTSSADCVGHPLGTVCNTASGACGTSCVDDTNCTSSQWCSSSVCITKTPNGQTVPAPAGLCSPAVAARACLSGVCETADNLCGLSNGKACSTSDAGADAGALTPQCRSGICFAGDNLCGKPDKQLCSIAADCRSAKCDTNVCVMCMTDAQCGDAQSGKVCNDQKTCVDGCRGIGGPPCTPPLECTSKTSDVGTCAIPIKDAGPDVQPAEDAGEVDAGRPDATTSDASADSGLAADQGRLAGSGLACAASPGNGGGALALVALGALATTLAARRRSRRTRSTRR